MSALTKDEREFMEMMPFWFGLDAVRARDEQLTEFIRCRLPKDAKFNAAGMTEALRIARQFTCPYRVPSCKELVEADRIGRLGEKISELNREFRGEGSA